MLASAELRSLKRRDSGYWSFHRAEATTVRLPPLACRSIRCRSSHMPSASCSRDSMTSLRGTFGRFDAVMTARPEGVTPGRWVGFDIAAAILRTLPDAAMGTCSALTSGVFSPVGTPSGAPSLVGVSASASSAGVLSSFMRLRSSSAAAEVCAATSARRVTSAAASSAPSTTWPRAETVSTDSGSPARRSNSASMRPCSSSSSSGVIDCSDANSSVIRSIVATPRARFSIRTPCRCYDLRSESFGSRSTATDLLRREYLS
jgi:hypothetical protein